MPLATGTAVVGTTGSLAIMDKDGVGTLRYIPVANVTPTISRGDSVIPLVSNDFYPSNVVKGSVMADVSIETYLFVGLINAAMLNAAVGNGAGDVGTAGYSQITVRSNSQGGEGAQNYGRSKCASLNGSVRFSNNGGAQAMRLGLRYTSVDPLGTATPLAAPAAGSLSNANILGFAQASFTGASDVVAVSFSLDTGLAVIPGVVAGTNAEYGTLPKGLLQTILSGTVTLTQIANPATRLGSSGSGGTFTLSLGTVGAGISMQFEVIPMSQSKSVEVGIGYIQNTYVLKSVNGTDCPFFCADL